VWFVISICAVALAFGCRDRSPDAPPAPAIEISAAGSATMRIIPGHPCRATIEGVEMIVGGRPLVSQLANTRWTGDDAGNGTTLREDGSPVARLYPIDDPAKMSVFDPAGVPMIQVFAAGKNATVSDHRSEVIRKIDATPTGFAILDMHSTSPVATATGTTDVVLVGVVTSPELTKQVRALAACSRLLPVEHD
jgi:antitoxin (DNA-binding transcriptional repressor) of toxin-antitoxin stability system